MLTLPPFKSAKDISAIQDLYFKIADYIPNNKVSNIIASPFKTNTKIFHEILLKLNTLNDLDSDRHFRITTAETKEKIIRRTETTLADNYRILAIQDIKDESLLNDVRDLQEQNTPLQGLEELLKRENNAEIVAYKVKSNLVIGSTKQLTTKQWLIIYRLQYQIFRSQYTTPMARYAELLDALIDENIEKANQYIDEILADKSITDNYAEKLGNVFKYNKEQRLDNIKSQIDYTRTTLQNLVEQYNERQRDLENQLENYERIKNENKKVPAINIGRHIIENKNITRAQQFNDHIQLTYLTPLINFNEDAAEDAAVKRSQFAKDVINTMINGKYTLYTECVIVIYEDMSIQAQRSAATYHQFIGQPHLDNYACYGDHIDYINQFADNFNIIGLIDQVTEMAMNMNFRDGVVTDQLMGILSTHQDMKTWKNNETGEYVSTREIMEELYGKTETDTGRD